jgi:putative transcriptional regulator
MELREARQEANLTQAEVADHLGVSRPTYIKMEKHPDEVTISDAIKLADLFGVKVDAIFFGRKV